MPASVGTVPSAGRWAQAADTSAPGVDTPSPGQAASRTVGAGEMESRLLPGMAGQLDGCLGRLARGPGDPTIRHVGGRGTALGAPGSLPGRHRVRMDGRRLMDQFQPAAGKWYRASRTPQGPALAEFVADQDDVYVRAWGPGASWALHQAPRLLGADDDPGSFQPDHPLLRRAVHDHPRLRIGATDLLMDALACAVIEQRVTSSEAYGSIHDLIRQFGELAPGPAAEAGHPASGMRVPPAAEEWASLPSWEYTRHGVDAHRASALVGLARRFASLQRALSQADAAGRMSLLTGLPGVGVWTAAKVLQQVYGDPDAWSDGDYHIPGMLTTALTGQRSDNEACRELLTRWPGHRYRVELLVGLAVGEQRHGPRRDLPKHVPGVGVNR